MAYYNSLAPPGSVRRVYVDTSQPLMGLGDPTPGQGPAIPADAIAYPPGHWPADTTGCVSSPSTGYTYCPKPATASADDSGTSAASDLIPALIFGAVALGAVFLLVGGQSAPATMTANKRRKRRHRRARR